MICPKCQADYIWIEKGILFENYYVNVIRCICGWSKEIYIKKDFLPLELIKQREEMFQEQENELDEEWRRRKTGAIGGKLRKPRIITYICKVCGKEDSYLTLGNPQVCRTCRLKIKKKEKQGEL